MTGTCQVAYLFNGVAQNSLMVEKRRQLNSCTDRVGTPGGPIGVAYDFPDVIISSLRKQKLEMFVSKRKLRASSFPGSSTFVVIIGLTKIAKRRPGLVCVCVCVGGGVVGVDELDEPLRADDHRPAHQSGRVHRNAPDAALLPRRHRRRRHHRQVPTTTSPLVDVESRKRREEASDWSWH